MDLDLIKRIQTDETPIQITLVGKTSGVPVILTNWQIYCQITNDRGSGTTIDPIKKATAGIPDGSDTQLKIIDADKGILEIYFDSADTEEMVGSAIIEIWRAEDAGNSLTKQLIVSGFIEFIEKIAVTREITP